MHLFGSGEKRSILMLPINCPHLNLKLVCYLILAFMYKHLIIKVYLWSQHRRLQQKRASPQQQNLAANNSWVSLGHRPHVFAPNRESFFVRAKQKKNRFINSILNISVRNWSQKFDCEGFLIQMITIVTLKEKDYGSRYFGDTRFGYNCLRVQPVLTSQNPLGMYAVSEGKALRICFF